MSAPDTTRGRAFQEAASSLLYELRNCAGVLHLVEQDDGFSSSKFPPTIYAGVSIVSANLDRAIKDFERKCPI